MSEVVGIVREKSNESGMTAAREKKSVRGEKILWG